MSETEELAALRKKIDELERTLCLPHRQELSKEAAALGETCRRLFQVNQTQASLAFGERVKTLAGRHNLLVEWTVRDVSGTVEDSAVCRCSCYA